MKLPKTSSIISLILLIGIFVSSVSADDSKTVTKVDDATREENNFEVRIVPESVRLKPLQTVTFHAIITTPNGNQYEAPKDYTQWRVLKGGGHITDDGVFRAGEIPGEYSNTIAVQVLAKQAHASAKILDLIVTTPSPTPGLVVIDITPTPKETPTPSPTPVNLPSTTVIIPTFIPPTPTPTEPLPRSTSTTAPTPTKRPLKIATPTPSPENDGSPTVPTTRKEHTSNIYDEDNVQLCLQTVYSTEIYNRFFNPNGERKDPSELGSLLSAAERCFTVNRIIDLDEETASCLKEILSNKRYVEITIDNSDPTADELQRAKECTAKPREISYARKNEVDPSLLTCLEIRLGPERLQSILASGQRTLVSELTDARECFTLDEGITQPPLVISIPNETQTCLEDALGVEQAANIQNGTREPTSEERSLASACFSETLDDSQQTFMPPPVEQLAYIETARAGEVAITAVKATTHIATEVITLSGKAGPYAIVDIYIFSNPIIVSTTADANGDWFYELSYHLDDGDHEAYTVVQHSEKGYVKSEVFAFNVARAESGTTATPELVVEPINTTSATRTYLVAAVGTTGAGLILLLLVGYWFTKKRPESIPNNELNETEHPNDIKK